MQSKNKETKQILEKTDVSNTILLGFPLDKKIIFTIIKLLFTPYLPYTRKKQNYLFLAIRQFFGKIVSFSSVRLIKNFVVTPL